MSFDPHLFLKNVLHTDEMNHRGNKTVYEHLNNVEKILKICGCDEDICLAGLFHNIYGTTAFQKKISENREEIRKIIGKRAESLVWIFCNAKRPYCWLFGQNIPLEDGSCIRISKQDLHALHMIEGANLLEQQGGLKEIISFASRKELDSAPARLLYPTPTSE